MPLEAWPERLPELLHLWQLRNRASQGAVEMVAPLTGVVREIVVKEGDEVSVKVIGFDRGKVKLSIKEAV